MSAQKKTENDRMNSIEKKLSAVSGRVHQCERALRIIGEEFQKQHLSEGFCRSWARRANSLSNSMRDIRHSLKVHGGEFDREPYISDPDNDYQWRSED